MGDEPGVVIADVDAASMAAGPQPEACLAQVDEVEGADELMEAPLMSLVSIAAPGRRPQGRSAHDEEMEPGEKLRRLRARVLARREAQKRRENGLDDADDACEIDNELRAVTQVNLHEENAVALLEDGALRGHIDAARQRLKEIAPRKETLQSSREAYVKALRRISAVVAALDDEVLQPKKEEVELGHARVKACQQIAARGVGAKGYPDLPLVDLPEIVDVVTPVLQVAAKDMMTVTNSFEDTLTKVEELKKLLFMARRDLDVVVDGMFVQLERDGRVAEQQAELARLLARAERVLARQRPEGLAQTRKELLPSSLQEQARIRAPQPTGDAKGKGRAEEPTF